MRALVVVLVTTGCFTPGTYSEPDAEPGPPVDVQVLAINDFHGHLEPSLGSDQVARGGAAYLATHVRNERARQPNTIFVSAGDLFGNTPFLSQWFHDEGTIEVMGQMGLDLDAVGNHEFDEGWPELQRMRDGGCHPVDGCRGRMPYPMSPVQLIGANIIDPATNMPVFPPYVVREIDGVKIAFIGMTLERTPDITFGAATSGLEFRDEVETANALVPEIRAQGIRAIIVVIHEGGLTDPGTINDCNNLTGSIVPIAEQLDPEIDVVISGHTHRIYNCTVASKLVTSSECFGHYYTRYTLSIDRATGEILTKSATNIPVSNDVAPATDIQATLAFYRQLADAAMSLVVGSITADITRVETVDRETALHLRVADGMLAATAGAGDGGAQLALINFGGVRQDLLYAKSGSELADGQVTFAELFAMLPFQNSMVSLTMKGSDIEQALEDLFIISGNRWLYPSATFSFQWSASAATGNKIDPATMKLNGVTMDPNADYRVTVPNILADDAAHYPAFQTGRDRFTGATDQDVFEAYLSANQPLSPPTFGRIQMVP